jgi:hypothetical protein
MLPERCHDKWIRILCDVVDEDNTLQHMHWPSLMSHHRRQLPTMAARERFEGERRRHTKNALVLVFECSRLQSHGIPCSAHTSHDRARKDGNLDSWYNDNRVQWKVTPHHMHHI